MTIGRPTKYKIEYNEQAYKLCLLGATDEELADFFKVHVSTIYEWKNEHDKFSESIRQGKEIADAEVAEALYKSAKGYSHPDVDIKVVNGEIVETPIVKHYPPNPTSMVFWLKNRQPSKFRDKQALDLSGELKVETKSIGSIFEE